MRFLLVFALLCPLPAQAADRLPQRIEQQLLHSDFAGVVMLAQGAARTFGRAFGSGVQLDSQFRVGSISKQISAVLALRASEQGRLDLQQPLAEALPEQARQWQPAAVVGQLMNHSSGLGGSGFAYSNPGYDLLGQLIARQGGSYAQQLNALLQQCRMQHSSMADSASFKAPQLLSGEELQDDGRWQSISPQFKPEGNPSGGLIASAADLIRWNQCLHHGGLLNRASYRAMTTPGIQRPHRWGALGYGYGLQISQQDGLLEYSHNGYIPGFQSSLFYYPQADISLVLLEKRSRPAADISRAFAQHDAVRQLLRAHLLEQCLQAADAKVDSNL